MSVNPMEPHIDDCGMTLARPGRLANLNFSSVSRATLLDPTGSNNVAAPGSFSQRSYHRDDRFDFFFGKLPLKGGHRFLAVIVPLALDDLFFDFRIRELA